MLPKPAGTSPLRFGVFELDVDAEELRRDGRRVKLQPQPFKLLKLLASQPDRLVTREDIRRELWPEGTFVDFDQAVNFAVRQVRDALRDSAEHPLYIETVPKRGYRFIAPVQGIRATAPAAAHSGGDTVRLNKALWANIAEIRLRERRQRRYFFAALVVLSVIVAVLAFRLISHGSL